MDANKAVVTRFVHEVQDQHRLDVVDEIFDPGYIDHASQDGAPLAVGSRAIAGFRQFYGGMLRAFPDVRVHIDDQIAEGDLVVTRKTFTGTMTGELWGAAPTGRGFRFEVIDIMRVADGRIAEHWAELDMLALARQLGIRPPGQPS